MIKFHRKKRPLPAASVHNTHRACNHSWLPNRRGRQYSFYGVPGVTLLTLAAGGGDRPTQFITFYGLSVLRKLANCCTALLPGPRKLPRGKKSV